MFFPKNYKNKLNFFYFSLKKFETLFPFLFFFHFWNLGSLIMSKTKSVNPFLAPLLTRTSPKKLLFLLFIDNPNAPNTDFFLSVTFGEASLLLLFSGLVILCSCNPLLSSCSLWG